jgi:hypothetical protein
MRLRKEAAVGCRIFIENPPPFRWARRRNPDLTVSIPVEEGLETIRTYLGAGLPVVNFHHSDLDEYEVRQRGGRAPPPRHDTFEYVEFLRRVLGDFGGILVPHRVVVYERPVRQEGAFERLADDGVKSVVLVGKPFTKPPPGIVYQSSVEEMLHHLRIRLPDFHLGVIGIHLRTNEAERIARKFAAAGGRLRVMGQFLDETGTMAAFMDQLALEFDRRRLSLAGLEWNIGLAIFALRERTFYAKLLRKSSLACEERFHDLASTAERIDESVRMNLEFAETLYQKGKDVGLDVGFSIQPLIERLPDGSLHPSVDGTLKLAKGLNCLVGR